MQYKQKGQKTMTKKESQNSNKKGQTMPLNTPSQEDMKRVFALWDKQSALANYDIESKALELLFTQYPHNTNLSEVALKVACLDSFYSTNATMYAKVPDIAQKIISIKDFDKRVQRWDEKLVKELADFDKAKLYSFASKYCTLHNVIVYKRDDFVIFDSIVREKLKEFKKKFGKTQKYTLTNFTDKDFALQNYGKYKQILENFKEDFKLNCSLRELDWYLWKLGKVGQA